MEAKELKIGDWVSHKGKPVQISHMNFPWIYIDNWSGDEVLGVQEYGLSPIPLTSEILEKNGWVEGNWEWRNGWLALEVPTKDPSEWKVFADNCRNTVRLHNIKYVHELQHLLWALGMDDDLKI